VDHAYYSAESQKISQIISKYGDASQLSIDEWLLEIKQIPEENARALKSEIYEKSGLTCSIGVAPSALGAKMACAECKPDGILILDKEEETRFIAQSSIQKVVGIGAKTAGILNEMGVSNVKDLAKKDPVFLVEKFGKKTGSFLVNLAKGNLSNLMGPPSGEQSEISRIATLEHPSSDISLLMEKIRSIEKDNKNWIRENKLQFKTLTISFVSEDMKQASKSVTFRNPRNWNEDLDSSIRMLVQEFLARNKKNIRRIGIKFSNFSDIAGQKTLSDDFLNLLEF
jgi:DNA polymerase IV (DinB-like DNA polymerase)